MTERAGGFESARSKPSAAARTRVALYGDKCLLACRCGCSRSWHARGGPAAPGHCIVWSAGLKDGRQRYMAIFRLKDKLGIARWRAGDSSERRLNLVRDAGQG